MSTSPARAVRLGRPPACDPPYDDERHPEAWGSGAWDPLPQPPLDLPDPAPVPVPGPPPARPRPGGRAQPAAASASPPARVTAARFLQSCLEIVNGLRPAAHIRSLASPLEANTIVSALTHAARRLRRRCQGQRITLRRMRICEPYPDIIEIAAVIGTRERVWAAAFRLERRHARWRCTAAAIL